MFQTAILLPVSAISATRALNLFADPDVSREHNDLKNAVEGWSNWLAENQPKDAAARRCVANAGRSLQPRFMMTRPEQFLAQLAGGWRELERCKALCDLPMVA